MLVDNLRLYKRYNLHVDRKPFLCVSSTVISPTLRRHGRLHTETDQTESELFTSAARLLVYVPLGRPQGVGVLPTSKTEELVLLI